MNNNLVVTLCSGEDYTDMESVFGQRMYDYASKYDADFIIMTDDVHKHRAYNKLEIKQFSEKYDRILYLDADIIIRKDAPNIFDFVPEDSLGIFDESYLEITPNILEDTIKCYDLYNVMDLINSTSYLDRRYYNTGVMLFNKENISILNNDYPEIEEFYADQGYLNYQIKDKSIKVFDIGFQFNGLTTHKCYGENGMDRIRNTFFIHFNGANTFKDKSEYIKEQMKYIEMVEKELGL